MAMIHWSTEVDYLAFIMPDEFEKWVWSTQFKLMCNKMQEETNF